MMPTDEERREVAKRLRGIEAVQFDEGELVDCGEVEAELGLASDDGAWYRLEDVLRLADLIEPEPERTCRAEYRRFDDDGSQGAYFVCSACGERLRYREVAADDGEPDYELLPYCAGCGARVEGGGEMSYQEEQQPRTCGDCEEFRMCCGCGAGWCMKLLEPTHRDDFACASRMEGCAI